MQAQAWARGPHEARAQAWARGPHEALAQAWARGPHEAQAQEQEPHEAREAVRAKEQVAHSNASNRTQDYITQPESGVQSHLSRSVPPHNTREDYAAICQT